jgi:hypothetical protein
MSPPARDRPEVLILGLVDPMEAHARILRIDLEIKGCSLDELLLLAGEAGEAVSEGIGDEKLHVFCSSR